MVIFTQNNFIKKMLTKNTPFKVRRYDLSEVKEGIGNGFGFVYFLFKDFKIVYVGQTVNHPITRISNHFTDKDFDSYSMVKVEKKKLTYAEAKYIFEYNPMYNKSMPCSANNELKTGYVSTRGIKRILGEHFSRDELKSFFLDSKYKIAEKLNRSGVKAKIIGDTLAVESKTLLENAPKVLEAYKLEEKTWIESQKTKLDPTWAYRNGIYRNRYVPYTMRRKMIYDCNNRA